MLIPSGAGFVQTKGVRGNIVAGIDFHMLTNWLHSPHETLSGTACNLWLFRFKM